MNPDLQSSNHIIYGLQFPICLLTVLSSEMFFSNMYVQIYEQVKSCCLYFLRDIWCKHEPQHSQERKYIMCCDKKVTCYHNYCVHYHWATGLATVSYCNLGNCLLLQPADTSYHIELCLCVIVFETSWYAQYKITVFTFFLIQYTMFVWVWHIAQSVLLSVVVRQCWQLLFSRQPILVTKVGLPRGFGKHVSGPASSTIFFTNISWKPLLRV
jgi:hypothetical protein